MKKITSSTTFFRTQLKVRGKSQHNGRGMIKMANTNVPVDQLLQRLNVCIVKWEEQGLIEKVTRTDKHTMVTLKEEKVVKKYYRELRVNNLTGQMCNVF